jgi:hypothetical protein
MPPKASLRFLSLFVPDLEQARRTYEALLGTPPSEGPSPAPAPHPFAAAGVTQGIETIRRRRRPTWMAHQVTRSCGGLAARGPRPDRPPAPLQGGGPGVYDGG